MVWLKNQFSTAPDAFFAQQGEVPILSLFQPKSQKKLITIAVRQVLVCRENSTRDVSLIVLALLWTRANKIMILTLCVAKIPRLY